MDKRSDVYVRDVAAQTTTLLSRANGADGPKGNDGSFEPSISGDGRLMTFSSRATNLTADDRDGGVFICDLSPAG